MSERCTPHSPVFCGFLLRSSRYQATVKQAVHKTGRQGRSQRTKCNLNHGVQRSRRNGRKIDFDTKPRQVDHGQVEKTGGGAGQWFHTAVWEPGYNPATVHYSVGLL